VDEDTTALVPENWFDNPLEMTLGEYLLEKARPILELLPERDRLFIIGAGISTGGNYKNINITGKLNVKDHLLASQLNVTGKGFFNGFVFVNGNTVIAGKVSFNHQCIFIGNSTVSGKISFEKHLISSGILNIKGKAMVEGNIYTDNEFRISGHLKANTIKSTSLIISKSNLEITEKIIAKEFISFGGGSVGEINANQISIGFSNTERLKRLNREFDDREKLTNPSSIGKYLVNVVKGISIFNRNKETKILEIQGDLIGDNVEVANCVINGSIKANNVKIGHNVQIIGQIEYTQEIDVLDGEVDNYTIKQIDKHHEIEK